METITLVKDGNSTDNVEDHVFNLLNLMREKSYTPPEEPLKFTIMQLHYINMYCMFYGDNNNANKREIFDVPNVFVAFNNNTAFDSWHVLTNNNEVFEFNGHIDELKEKCALGEFTSENGFSNY